MPYGSKIILDSIGPAGTRLTTWELTYPRFVHAELMTHRLFSRNSASSRAIPSVKLMARVQEDPAMPVWWGKNQAGMQAREELPDTDEGWGGGAGDWWPTDLGRGGKSSRQAVRAQWLHMRDQMLEGVRHLNQLGLHKQIANRPLEAWMFITVLVTATDFGNWFHQRHHKDAQPEIQWVAQDMWSKYQDSKPRPCTAGEWHMPFLKPSDTEWILDVGDGFIQENGGSEIEVLKRLSVARCARVSYLQHDGVHDPVKDLELVGRLALARLEDVDPKHWSPFEHVAHAMTAEDWNTLVARQLGEHIGKGKPMPAWVLGNFTGWMQYRKTFRGEHVELFAETGK